MPNFLVVSTSGNPRSRSRRMGRAALAALETQGKNPAWLDLSEIDLPLCDAHQCYSAPGARRLVAEIEAADGILVAAPVYNFDVSASAKNMIELTGSAWDNKIVAFVCAAGGMSSYMSVMAYANSLMLDFRCIIVPRFVYATGAAFDDEKIVDRKVAERIEQVAAELVRITEALR